MKLEAERPPFKFIMEEDSPDVGVYLYIFLDGKCVRDELQNDIATCKKIALGDYAVTDDLWKTVQE